MIALGVEDLDRSIRFYRDGLGFPKVETSPEVAFFDLNGSWLGLCRREALAKDAGVSPEGGGYNNFSLAHNVESEVEVERVMDQAISAGGEVIKPPQRASWGGYSGYFSDPDGHLWEVAYNPFEWIGPKDEEP
jgi:hypothetical protein